MITFLFMKKHTVSCLFPEKATNQTSNPHPTALFWLGKKARMLCPTGRALQNHQLGGNPVVPPNLNPNTAGT
jgi:hypothetical protein